VSDQYIYKELTGKVISAAIAVSSELKPGLDEKIYENALLLELLARGHKVDQQKQFPVFYRNNKIGLLIPDLIVDDTIIVDPKVVVSFNENHVAQMTGYLSITSLDLALLINFKFAKIKAKRVIRSLSAPSAHSVV